MKVADIPTAKFNHILDELRSEGWRKAEEYDAFDAWIDYGRVVLVKGGDRLEFEWDNWMEGAIDGSDAVVLQLKERYGF